MILMIILILFRIKKANRTVGILKQNLGFKHVNISAKVHIYLAIPVNLLIWGCQTWDLIKALINMLEVFHMRCLRWILNIKWTNIQKQRITNLGKNLKILIQ